METRIYKQKCKDCEMDYYVEDLKVIGASSCPKCNGKGVHISEHKIKSERCCGDAVDALMYALPSWIPPPVKKEKPLLTIELQDETAVPKVFYEGKEITGKVRVSFDWITKGAEPLSGGTKFNVEYNETGHDDLVKRGIGLSRGKYAID